MYVICRKYRIIILIIIIISLVQILLSYSLLQTHHTNARTRARTLTRTGKRRSGSRCSIGRWRPTVTQLTPLSDGSEAINRGWSLVHSNKYSCGRHGFREFFAYKKILGRNETRIHARKCCQSIKQFETYSEQELRSAVCELRWTE